MHTNVAWSGAGSLVFAASQWVVVVAVAKIIGAEALGRYALGLAIAAPVFALTGMQLKAVLGTDVRAEFAFNDYLRTRLWFSCLGLGVIAAATLAVESSATRIVVLAVGAVKAVESLSDITCGVFQKRRRMDRIARSLLYRAVLGAPAFAAAALLSGSIVAGIAAMGVCWAGVLIAHDLPVARALEGAARSSGGRVRHIVRRTWPMAAALAVGTLTAAAPRLLLQRCHGEAAVGIYSALFYGVTANLLIATAVAQAAAPRIAQGFAGGSGFQPRLFATVSLWAAGLGAVLLLGAACLGKPLLSAVYTPAFAEHYRTFVLLSAAGIPAGLACICDYALIAMRFGAGRIINNAAGALLATGAGLLLIPRLAVAGAALSYVVGACSLCLGGLACIASASWEQNRCTKPICHSIETT